MEIVSRVVNEQPRVLRDAEQVPLDPLDLHTQRLRKSRAQRLRKHKTLPQQISVQSLCPRRDAVAKSSPRVIVACETDAETLTLSVVHRRQVLKLAHFLGLASVSEQLAVREHLARSRQPSLSLFLSQRLSFSQSCF
eukprot:3746119-Rhodomonas_salina.3